MAAARKRARRPPPAAERCTAKTASGKRCRHRRAPESELCRQHADAGSRGGRPGKLTPDVAARVIALLKVGGYAEVAAGAAGISRQSFERWMERGDPEGTAREDAPHREFRAAVEVAMAQGEADLVEKVEAAAAKDWRAAAWLLERQAPERWAGPRSSRQQPSSERPSGLPTSGDGPGLRLVDDQVAADGSPL